MRTLYRTESYSGSGIRNIADIIEYEMSELRNTDIPEYILSHYALSPQTREDLRDILALRPTGEYPFTGDREDLRNTIKALLEDIGRETGTPLRYGLWLAERGQIERRYSTTKGDIDGYPTSPVILSNLGPDGILFGYADMPEKNGQER